jgi:hypothetical protein
MPFVPALNVAEIVVQGVLGGQQIRNIFHVQNSGPWTPVLLAIVGNAFRDAWEIRVQPLLSNDMLFQNLHLKDLTTSMGIELDIPWGVNGNGGVGNAAVDGNVALCIGHKTGLAGRSARGRTYIAGLPENTTTNSLIPEGVRVPWLNAFNGLRDDMFAAGGALGILSRYSGYTQSPPKYKKIPTPRAAGIFNTIQTNTVDGIVDSMRRRLPGRGV